MRPVKCDKRLWRDRLLQRCVIPPLAAVAIAPTPPDPNDFDADIYAAVYDVDTGGAGDYTTVGGALSALGATYLNNAKKVALVYRSSTGAADKNGATAYPEYWGMTELEIWQAASDRHTGVLATDKYRADAFWSFRNQRVLIDGLQIHLLTGGSRPCQFRTIAGADVTVRNCLAYQPSASNWIWDVANWGGGNVGTYRFLNCVAIMLDSAYGALTADAGTILVDHCTLRKTVGGGALSRTSSAAMTVTNTLCHTGTGTVSAGTTGSHNSTSLSEWPVAFTNSRVSQTFSFVAAAGHDFRWASNDGGAKGHGVASGAAWDYGFDAVGNAWAAAPAIGFHQP